MATFTECDPATVALARRSLRDHHPDLVKADVTVCHLFAWGKDGEPALKWHGYQAAATIKINSYADRVEGKTDCTLRIDGAAWEDMTEKQKLALLRHEFLHLELQRDEQGNVKEDDAGRPKLKLRLHDIQVGGFEQVLKEFGRDAVEAKVLDDIFKRPVVQGVLNWG